VLKLNKNILRATTFLLAIGLITGCSSNSTTAQKNKKPVETTKPVVVDKEKGKDKEAENKNIVEYKKVSISNILANDDGVTPLDATKVYSGFGSGENGAPIPIFAYQGKVIDLTSVPSEDGSLTNWVIRDGNIIEGTARNGQLLSAIVPENMIEKLNALTDKADATMQLVQLDGFDKKVAFIIK
jgi:hypothetical protein